jgi:hypothetical protein
LRTLDRHRDAAIRRASSREDWKQSMELAFSAWDQ